MWVKVDDGFVEHPKVMAAARHLGANGAGRVVAVWLEAICYAARNLTDGLVPILIARKFITDRRPLDVLDVMAMPDVRLMTKTDTGYRFHDFEHYQPSAAAVKEKRQRERERKSTKVPHGIRAESARQIPGGIATASARIPERSRARDPVPSPKEHKKEQCADAHAASTRVLLKLAHVVLDDISEDADAPPISELTHRLGDTAAQYGIPYATARELTKAMDSAVAQRRRRAS
jgi:hypothetical protein